MNLTSYGAAEEVTGSKHVIELKDGTKILLDCGMFQGRGAESSLKNEHLDFDPKSIDYLLLSHAHIDHSGNIPYLVKKGFTGKIICTTPTYDLLRIMLPDSAHIQQSEADYINKHRLRQNKPTIEPLYDTRDVMMSWQYFEKHNYGKWFSITPEIKVKFTDAGHILGSAVINIKIKEGKREKKIAYSGDIGRFMNKILKQPAPFPQADIVICEATYGNREHSSAKKALEELKQAVYETCYAKGGKLIIPAFSVGKTQELIYTLNKLEFEGKLPQVKVFVDSPLAINATEIVKNHKSCYSKSIQKFIEEDPDPFGFDQLYYVMDLNESKAINELREPCIIISASGMAEAGRIKHHIKNNIENPNNAILIIGYSEPSTLAGRLIRGDKVVGIYGQDYHVKATVYNIDFYSAHADSNEIVRFLSYQDPDLVDKLFLVHGNKGGLEELQKKSLKHGFKNVIISEVRKTYSLD